jgi:X-X-X-Leu-X-X-Gly heptad repeat protein
MINGVNTVNKGINTIVNGVNKANSTVVSKNNVSSDSNNKLPSTKVETNAKLAYQQDIYNLKNSGNLPEKMKNLGLYIWDRFPGRLAEINEQIALIDGLDPQSAKIVGDLSSGISLENFSAVTINGIKAYKNI